MDVEKIKTTTPEGFKRLEDNVIFIACSQDLKLLREEIESMIRSVAFNLASRLNINPYSWDIEINDNGFDQTKSMQKNLPRPSDPKCLGIVCLMGERIGHPLENDFDLQIIEDIASWTNPGHPFRLVHPWPDDSEKQKELVKEGCYPLTGTVFEFIDAYSSKKPVKFCLIADQYVLPHNYSSVILNDFKLRKEKGGDPKIIDFGSWMEKDYDLQTAAVKNFACALSKKGIDQNAQNNPLEVIKGIKKFIVHEIFQENKQINPYKFLDYYDQDDAYNFHGRQNEIKNAKQKLLERFRSVDHPNLLRISGNSGAGKSSFLRAGLLASFQASEYRDDIKTVVFRPTDFDTQANTLMPHDIIRSIIDFFQEQTEINIPYHEIRDITDPYNSSSHRVRLAVQLLAKKVVETTQRETSKIIFGIDQFEEIVDHLSIKKYAAYWHPLVDFMEVAAQNNTIGIVYTLESSRKETFENLNIAPRFGAGGEIEIDGYASGFLNEIIEQPFRRAGYPLPHEITGKIKKNIKEKLVSTDGPRTEQSILPLLALMLSKLFDYIQDKYPAQDIDSIDTQDIPFENHSGQTKITRKGIQLDQTIKGLIEFDGLIDKEANQAWHEAKHTDQVDTDEIDHFLQPLVSVGGDDFNHIQLRTVAKRPYDDEQNLEEKFKNHRLLVPVDSKGFRLVHEAVIRYWSKALKWFENRKEFLKKEEIFRLKAKEWSANGKSNAIPVTPKAIDIAAEILLVYSRNWSLRDTNDLSHENRVLCEYCMFLFRHSQTPLKPIEGRKNPKTHVHLAAAYGMIDLLEKFAKIENNCLSFSSLETGITPLMDAAWHQKDTVSFLLERGVKPQKEKEGWPPIAAPIRMERLDIFLLLLRYHKEDKGLYGPNGVNMLHLCAQFDRVEMAKILMGSSELEPNQRDNWNRLPIHYAAIYGKIDAFKFFAGWSDITVADIWGQTVLHLAASNAHLNIVRYLINNHSFRESLNAISDAGKTALHMAAEKKVGEIVRALLHVCDPNQPVPESKQTPLHLAVAESDASENSLLETVEVLLANKNVNPNLIDSNGDSPLATASHLPKVQKRLLRSKSLDPNLSTSKSGETPLLISLRLGDWESFRMMKNRSATIPEGFLDKEGNNVFHLLAAQEYVPDDITDWILEEINADINAINRAKLTPLKAAIKTKNWKMVQSLLSQKGINPSIRHNKNISSLLLALMNNADQDILNELISISPSLLADQDYFGWTPLHRAVFCNQSKWTAWLETKDIDSLWKTEDDLGRLPISLSNNPLEDKRNTDMESIPSGIPKSWDSELLWEPAVNKESEDLIKQINLADNDFTVDESTNIHIAPLSFYDPNKVKIVRLSSNSWSKKNLNIYFLFDKHKLYRLNGTSKPIHEANKKIGIALEPANVLDYLRFFCFFVRGDEGPFFIAEDIGLPEIPPSLTTEERDRLKRYLRPACLNSIQGKHEEFLIIAPVYYSNAVYFGDFSVTNVGMIEVINDYSVVSDLSARVVSPIS